MGVQTIKVSLQSIEIPAINVYVHAISILVVLFLVKLIFGKTINTLVLYVRDKLSAVLNKKTCQDWIAYCRERKNWPQKQDALSLDLKGRYIKSLNFSITVRGKPQYWRAGFVLGNEKLIAQQIVDNKNGVTIHTGSDYDKKEKLLPVWKYYDNFSNGNPDYSSVKFEKMDERNFSISISNDNFMKVKLQDEVIFAQRINPLFRRRVYLKAWADTKPDCKIKFKKITYTLDS